MFSLHTQYPVTEKSQNKGMEQIPKHALVIDLRLRSSRAASLDDFIKAIDIPANSKGIARTRSRKQTRWTPWSTHHRVSAHAAVPMASGPLRQFLYCTKVFNEWSTKTLKATHRSRALLLLQSSRWRLCSQRNFQIDLASHLWLVYTVVESALKMALAAKFW